MGVIAPQPFVWACPAYTLFPRGCAPRTLGFSPPAAALICGPARPAPGSLFPRRKSNQKCASLRLERFDNDMIRAQRQGLVWSIDGADCGAAGQMRLPLRRALWAYHSLGLGA